jgi:hypothetical protein
MHTRFAAPAAVAITFMVPIVVLSVAARAAQPAAQPAPTPPRPAPVTFTKDVAPILYKNCVRCHRPDEIAPMSLLTYQEARPWAKAIRQRVAERTMPPWFADPAHGEFSNDLRLSQPDIDTIVAWVDRGAAKGDDRDMPPPPPYAPGWTISEPDVVFTMPEEYAVPADGVIPYLYYTVPTNFTEDKWIQALEIRPGNRKVVHHVIVSVLEPSAARGPITQGAQRPPVDVVRSQLGGTTPNRPGAIFPAGTARLVKAGSSLVFQMHYTPNGEATKDRTSIGLIFAKTPPQKVLRTGLAANNRFVIPPGDANHEVRSATTVSEDVHLLTLMPHMHFRGKDFTYTAVYPDGRTEILLRVPKYDFNWQLTYSFKKPIALPKGTRIECVAHFDNSSGNLANPDPKAEVRWGDQTWEEMMIGWYSYTRDAEQPPVVTASGPSR